MHQSVMRPDGTAVIIEDMWERCGKLVVRKVVDGVKANVNEALLIRYYKCLTINHSRSEDRHELQMWTSR